MPTDVFSGLSLQKLDLESNKLKELPVEVWTFLFSGLCNLQELYLGGNDLSELPAEVFAGLGKLRKLNLGGNDLTELPATCSTIQCYP